MDIFQKLLSTWGAVAVRRSRVVLAAAALLALAAAPFTVRALRNIDVNLFNQASSELKRFQLMREITENFGGEMLVAVATIPDEHSAQDVSELKAFGVLLSAELQKAGTLDEDQAELSAGLRAEIATLAAQRKPKTPPAPPPPNASADESSGDAPEPEAPAQNLFQAAWLRNVECRAGQNLRTFVKAIGTRRPYVLIGAAEVERMKKLFEPEALAARMPRIEEEVRNLDVNSLEKKKKYEDPLGVAELAEQALQERFKRLAPPWAQDSDGFFLSPDGTTLIVLGRAVLPASRLDFTRALVAAAQRAENRAVRAFRETRAGLSVALKGASYGSLGQGETTGRMQVGFTGMPAIYVENERTLKWDMIVNTGTSLLGVLILFLVLYRSVALTWQVTWTTVFTIWLTIAFAGLARGGMSLLGGAFTAVPVGLGTDYAIMVYNMFQDFREKEGLSPEQAMSRALERCGPSIVIGAIITAIAFFGVSFTHLTGLAEFGILGGASALIGSATMLLVLPAAIAHSFSPQRTQRAQRNGKREGEGGGGVGKIARAGLSMGMPALGRMLERKQPRIAVLVFSALVLLGGILLIRFGPDPGPETVAGVRFDPELGNLRSLSNRAIPLRNLVTRRFNVGLADINTVVEAMDEGAAFEAQEQLVERARPFVERGELKADRGVLDYVPSPKKQLENIAALRTFDIDKAIKDFQAAAEKHFGVKRAAYFKPFLRHLRSVKMLMADPQPVTLAELMDGPLANMLAPYVNISTNKAPMGGANEPWPRLIHLRSSWLPKDGNQSSEWYADLARALERTAPPPIVPPASVKMTAAKMVGFELKDSTLRDCGWITLVVSICVGLSLAVALRSLTACLLALIPLVFAYLAMLAGVPISQMLHGDYTLNFVNLIMFPLLLGSAVDYGVYMVVAFNTHSPTVSQLMAQTGRSVLYCMGTTLIGFGSFVTSSYTGLLSMGVASLWGYAGATFGALVVLPAVLGCMRRK